MYLPLAILVFRLHWVSDVPVALLKIAPVIK